MAVTRERKLPKSTLTLDLPLHKPTNGPDHRHRSSDPRLSDYEKLRVLGHGNGGTVYQVRHRHTGSIFALKTLSSDDRRQIAREADIHRSTDSPSILRCHAVIAETSLLLEYMNAGSLESLLARRNSPFPEPAIAEIARQTLLGLSYLHSRKIVHRDIKPGNLLVNRDGEVKIGDFGVSKVMRRSLDPCLSYVGTCAYMSPERFNPDSGGGCYNAYAADVWSLGLTVLELRLGHFPLLPKGQRPDWATLMCAICFGEPPELPEEASPEFRDFVGRCLRKEAVDRGTVGELMGHPFIAGREKGEFERVFREIVLMEV